MSGCLPIQRSSNTHEDGSQVKEKRKKKKPKQKMHKEIVADAETMQEIASQVNKEGDKAKRCSL